MPDPREQLSDLFFPVNGLDLSAAFQGQRPQTTRTGLNVRAFEPLTQRMRGGSRPGLSRYLPQLPAGAVHIQHLNYVVDPAATALLANFPFPGPYIADPSSVGNPSDWPPGQTSRIPPGQRIPVGGTLVQPNKLVPMNKSAVFTKKISLRQTKTAIGLVDPTTHHQTFASNVLLNSVLVLGFACNNGSSGSGNTVTSVSDNLGNTYTEIGTASATDTENPAVTVRVSLWYGIVSTAGTCQVAYVTSGTGRSTFFGMEYLNVSTTTPTDTNGSGSGTGTSLSLSVSVTSSGEAVVAMFGTPITGQVWSPSSPWSLVASAGGANTGPGAAAVDGILSAGSLTVPAGSASPAASQDTSSVWCGVGVSLIPSG